MLILALVAGYGLAPAVQAQPAPARQALTVPVFARPGKSLEGVVAYGPAAPVVAVAFSPDGKLLATGGYQDVLLWDLAGGRLRKRLGVGGLNDLVQVLDFHKDGHLLAVAEGTASGPGAVKVFDVDTGALVVSFTEPKDVVYAMAFSPDGKWLAAGGADSVLHVWALDTRASVATLKDHGDWIRGVAFSPDGKFLASAGDDRTALVWEVGTWKRVSRLEEKEPVTGVVFSTDGQYVLLAVAGESERVLRLRKRDTGDVARSVDLGVSWPNDLVRAPQIHDVVVPCDDKAVRLYDAAGGNQVASLSGHAGWVYRAAVSPDGKLLASAGGDGIVKLWSVADGRPLATLVQLTPRSDDWLIATTAGYLAGSAPAVLQWKAAGLTTPADKLTGRLWKPELVQQVIAGKPVPAPDVP
jgi:WD40 repeat protein